MDLFSPTESFIPAGFAYYDHFLSVDEEARLLDELSRLALHPFLFQGYEAKRRVQSYGFEYNFDLKSIREGMPIPKTFDWLVNRVAEKLHVEANEVQELLVTEYPVGAQINWHRDAFPFEIIAGISLMSDCIFRFRPHDKAKQHRGRVISYPVRRRSLYVIQGEARMEWQHSIAPVRGQRYSITLRTLRDR